MAVATVTTTEFEASHGKPPRGRGRWIFEIPGDSTEAECQERYGDAHEAHLAANGECAWCHLCRIEGTGTYSQVKARLWPGTGPWTVMP